MTRSTALICLAAVLVVASLSGCSSLERLVGIDPGTTARAAADLTKGYCREAGPLGRQVTRNEIRAALVEEGIEICLGCKGDAETTCTGVHRPKVDDTGA